MFLGIQTRLDQLYIHIWIYKKLFVMGVFLFYVFIMKLKNDLKNKWLPFYHEKLLPNYSKCTTTLKNLRILTNISKALKLDRNQETKHRMETGSDMSSWQKRTWWSTPRTLSESMACKPLDWSLAVNTTVNPNSANRLTNAYPIPLFAPVTMATESSDHHLVVVVGWESGGCWWCLQDDAMAEADENVGARYQWLLINV